MKIHATSKDQTVSSYFKIKREKKLPVLDNLLKFKRNRYLLKDDKTFDGSLCSLFTCAAGE